MYLIGDLQGCDAPFQRLLESVNFSPSRDTLYLLGDLVNRGPDSLAVLRRLSALGDAAQRPRAGVACVWRYGALRVRANTEDI
jgi:bis(5'-nucleosyl)-tetraphosphatase (symmetrical)